MMLRSVLRLAAVVMMLPAVAGCTGAEPSRPVERHVIAGGGTTGVYYNYGNHLAIVMSDELGVVVEVAESNGSIENLERLAAGDALLGFTQGDTAVDAVAGVAPFDEPLPIEAVARVYDEFVHLVVPMDSRIEEIGDLSGARVSFGAPGSGTDVIARRLLRAADLDPSDLDNAATGIDASIEALLRGEVDAFFWVGGLPTPGVVDLAAGMPIRLVPIDELVDQVNAEHGGVYRHAVVPQGVYGLPDAVATMAVPNYLVTHADTPEDAVFDATRVLFEARLDIARHVPAAALLDRRRAIFTEPVELHEGALRYFRETKL